MNKQELKHRVVVTTANVINLAHTLIDNKSVNIGKMTPQDIVLLAADIVREEDSKGK